MICKACGDKFDWESRLEELRQHGQTPKPGEEQYCLECGAELFRGVILLIPPQLHSGKRRHAYELDPDPWQENNVRILEDG